MSKLDNPFDKIGVRGDKLLNVITTLDIEQDQINDLTNRYNDLLTKYTIPRSGDNIPDIVAPLICISGSLIGLYNVLISEDEDRTLLDACSMFYNNTMGKLSDINKEVMNFVFTVFTIVGSSLIEGKSLLDSEYEDIDKSIPLLVESIHTYVKDGVITQGLGLSVNGRDNKFDYIGHMCEGILHATTKCCVGGFIDNIGIVELDMHEAVQRLIFQYDPDGFINLSIEIMSDEGRIVRHERGRCTMYKAITIIESLSIFSDIKPIINLLKGNFNKTDITVENSSI